MKNIWLKINHLDKKVKKKTFFNNNNNYMVLKQLIILAGRENRILILNAWN